MNKEFIPYQQALALKELGFDEPCLGYYNYNGSHFFKYKPKTDDKNLTKAPLYQQAFRWFRDKYGLHRHICYFEDTTVWHGDIYDIKNGGLMNPPMELTNYQTYEEAELECLKKLIEIVKLDKMEGYALMNIFEEQAISNVINMLNEIEVTGEMMESIIREVGMEDQMLRQLVMKASEEELINFLDEKRELKEATNAKN